jgi:peptide/nickel transport system substrate-binding protein
MPEHVLRQMIQDVRAGRLERRRFIQTMVGLGLTPPLAAQMLASAGIAHAQPRAFTPTRRGGGGALRILYWQAVTSLNPHLATGTKDYHGSRIFYEPLADFDQDGNVVPILAAEVPSLANGGLARDGTWVTWRLKPGVTWHDGKPLTADDVIFTWEYATDPATAATSVGAYRDVQRIERLGDHAVKLVFKRPAPFWADAFCSSFGMVLPKHVFEPFKGARSREAPANLRPVGTGPYRYVDFKPGDALRAEINPGYHVPNRPFFDTVEVKGGGDAVSAARAVLQTGEYDFAWNMQVEDDILQRFEQGGKGRVAIVPGGTPEHIQLNQTDPWKEVDGERSSIKTVHPFLTDPAVRSALALLVDRGAIQQQIYGRQGEATANFLGAPSRYTSPNTRWEFSVDKANQVLDAGGWKRGSDGVRAKDGKRLKMVFQTSINAPRQKTQAIVKQAAAKAGIDLELKSIVASVYFSSDAGNPDTYNHFYADLQMYNVGLARPDPQFFMEQFCSWEVAQKANKWAGRNKIRWRNEDYDGLWRAAEAEMDPVKRAALFIRMNDLVIQQGVVVPVVARNGAHAVSSKLGGVAISTWSGTLWQMSHWYREG